MASLLANLGVLIGIVLVLIELRQNTAHMRLQLVDQINSRLYENNRVLLGDSPVESIEESLFEPDGMSYADFRILDAYLINAVNEWEDRFLLYEAGLVDAGAWQRRIDEDVAWFFGNQFAKNWWAGAGMSTFEPEFAEYVDSAIGSLTGSETVEFFERTRTADTRER